MNRRLLFAAIFGLALGAFGSMRSTPSPTVAITPLTEAEMSPPERLIGPEPPPSALAQDNRTDTGLDFNPNVAHVAK